MENMNSEDASDNMMMNSKLKSPNQGGETNTMDSFQDGGQHNLNSDRSQNDFPPNLDGPHMNSEMGNFSQGAGDGGIGNDNFGKMNENMPSAQMQGFNGGFSRSNFGMGDQHGGLPNTGSGDFPQQNSQYNQFGQQNMRPGYPPNSRVHNMPNRPSMSGGSMGMMNPNYNPVQQRFMSGPNIQQQGGPTPTLNQLLQNSNTGQRFQSGYGEYGMGQQKSGTDMGNTGYNTTQNWGGQQHQQRPGMNPYQQQMAGNQPFRNQGGQMYPDGGQARRTASMPPGYPQQQSQPTSSQFPGGGAQQFSPNSQRYPMQQTGQNRASGMPNQTFGQQQMAPQYNQQGGGMGNYGNQPNQLPPPPPQQPFMQSSQQPAPPPQQPQPQQQSQFSMQQNQQPINSQDVAGANLDDLSNDINSSAANSRGTPTSSGLHPAVTALRPSPSPVGSSGSRSNTPASVTGNQAGSPMPPRPPSTHLDGQGRIQSPMQTQGYNQPMMPPPMGPNQMPGYSNKIPHPNMMAGSQMAPFSQHNSQYPNQGNFNRSQGQGSMPGYGAQQNAYSSMSNQMPGNQMYGGSMGMNRNMPNSGNYPNSYPQGGSMSMMNSMNNQYHGNYGMKGTDMAGMNQGMSNAMPPSQGGMNSMTSPHVNNMGIPASAAPGMPSSSGPGMPGSGGPGMPGSGAPGMPGNGAPVMPGNAMPGMPGNAASGLPGNALPGSTSGMLGSGTPSIPGNAPPGSAAAKGAHAAAQAAMIAAANSAASRAPPYMRPTGPSVGPQGPSGPPGPPGPAGAGTGPQAPGQGPPQQAPQGRMFGQSPQPPQSQPLQQMNQMNYNSINQMQPQSNMGMNQMPHSGMDSLVPSSGTGLGPGPGPGQQGSGQGGPPTSSYGPMGPMGNSNSLSMTSSSQPMSSIGATMMSSQMAGGQPVPSSQGMPMSSQPQPPPLSNTPTSQPMGMNSAPMSGASTPNSGALSDGDVKPAVSVATTVGSTGTSVTQSITSPLTNTTESQAPNMPNASTELSPALRGAQPSQMQPHLDVKDEPIATPPLPNKIPTPTAIPPLPPPDEDSLPEKPKPAPKECASHPPTPASGVAPSPSASMSSFHDEVENISSPSWPGTPKPGGNEILNRMCDMADEPDRRPFLERVFAFLEEKGTPITAMPAISKTPLDLYRLYFLVREKGGLVEVTKAKKWRDISTALNVGSSGSAGFTLRKNYMKYLFGWECKVERGGIDPQPIIAQLEAMSAKKDKRTAPSPGRPAPSPAGSQNSQDAFRPPSTPTSQMFDPFAPNAQRPPSMPNDMTQPNMMPGNMMPNANMPNDGMMPPNTSMMPNSNMMPNPGMPYNQMMAARNMNNSSESVNVQDPFADDPNAVPNQYPRSGGSQLPPYSQSVHQQSNMSNSSFPYNRSNMSSTMPPYSMNQPASSGNFSQPQTMNSMATGGSQGGDQQFSTDPFHRGGLTASTDNFTGNRSMPPQDSFGPNQASMPGASTGPGPGPGPGQFNYGNQYERSRFNQNQQPQQQQQQPVPPGGMMGNQPIRPPGPGQMNMASPHTNTPEQNQMFPNRYSSQQMPPPPARRVPTPQQDQFSQQQQPPPQSYNQGSGQGFPPQRSFPAQNQFPDHAGQQQTPPPQGGMFGNHRSPQPVQRGDMFSGPQQKRFTEFPDRRDGFNMPPGYPQQQQQQTPQSQAPAAPSQQQPPSMPSQSNSFGDRPMSSQYPGYQQQRPGGFPAESSYNGSSQRYPGPPPPSQPYSHDDIPHVTGGFKDSLPPPPVPPYSGGSNSMPPYSGGSNSMSFTYPRDDFLDMRPGREQQQWPPMHHRQHTSQQGGAGYGSGSHMGSSSGSMPPYGMPYNRSMSIGPRMSPHRDNKHFFSPPKMQQKSASMPTNAQFHQPKKEIVFPPDSVEAVQPVLTKRRKITYRDICPVEAWRVMMALKSGLIAESTWALDTLSILLYDDNTVTYFSLQHLPGLLEVLLEHFRCCLNRVFSGSFNDLEIEGERSEEVITALDPDDSEKKQNCESGANHDISVTNNKKVEAPDYTFKTRCGKTVKIEEDSKDRELMMDDKKWDVYCGFRSSCKHWENGRGDMTKHILTCFESKDSLQFFRQQFFGAGRCKTKSTEDAQIETGKEDSDNAKEESSTVNTAQENNNNSADTKEVVPDNVECTDKSPQIKSEKEYCKSASVGNSVDVAKKTNMLTDCINKVTVKSEPKDPALDKVECDSECKVDSEVSLDSDVKTKEANEITDMEMKEENKENCAEVKQENTENCADNNCKSSVKDEAQEKVENQSDRMSEVDMRRSELAGLKRKLDEIENDNEEVEAYTPDEPPLCTISEEREEVVRRCICLSNIFRSLSFVPGNELEMSKHRGLMLVLGRLLLLHHRHPQRKHVPRKFEKDEKEPELDDNPCGGSAEWWWDTLDALRENTLVVFANIAGQLNLAQYAEEICMPIFDGLLHWAVCPSAYAQDPMPTMAPNSVLSPRRLVLEALCKLCVLENNVDLLLATPPFSRIVKLLSNLVKLLANQKEQVLREFAIVLLCSLVQGDSSAARAVALQHPSISLLIDFLETAEHHAMQVANQHGISMLQENPEMMGTSLDMLRRAALTLHTLAAVPENRPLFVHQERRFLQLVMSQILDQHVASILSDVLYQCSQV